MEKTFIAAIILCQLRYASEGVKKFLDGAVLYSEEPLGILFDLTPQMNTTLDTLASDGYVVYAVIQGMYCLAGGETVPAVSYLCLQ